MIEHAPYLPCERCSWMRPDCTCHPISAAFWDGQLRASERIRERQRSVARAEYLRGRWEAA